MESDSSDSNLTCEFCGAPGRIYDWQRPANLGGLKRFIVCPECREMLNSKIDEVILRMKKISKTEFDQWVKEKQRYFRSLNKQIQLPGV